MRRFLLTFLLAGLTLVGFAQNDISEKYSITTQMFLGEMNGTITINPDTKSGQASTVHKDLHPVNPRMQERIIASPDTIDGKVYISAFIRLTDNTNVSELEAKGVQVQEKFANGLITALIPIDKIEEVASIANVRRINVASRMQVFTHDARQKTNVDDILTLSTDAISSGLSKKYDGSGVILGVIDTGIDFNHIAFKDKNGNSRIKKAYVYNGSSAQEYSTITSSTLTDDKAEDHGTHTSSTAGGSSVIVNGSTVTVTDDHANATYGGIAPGADLYLAGINGLDDTYLANAVNKMVTYADAQGKPLVVSNSWGSQLGPHDGTGDVADIYNSLFGDSHPNRIALFAASNDAGKGDNTGGYHISGTATSSNPLRSILRCHYYSDTDDGFYYYGIISNAWSRSNVTMKCKIHVLNSSTGAILETVEVTPTTSGVTVSGLSTYYSGTLYAFKDYISASNKTQIMLYTEGLESRNYNSSYQSNYTLAVEFYPTSGSCVIDAWGGTYGYFSNYLTTSGYAWTAGSDDMSVSDEATIANVISIGAYVSSKTWKDYNGTSHTASEYTLGDIAGFSSYATAAESPTGLQYPWITAPGARLIAGVNHNHTTSVDSYSYYGSNFNEDLVVNSTSYPYAEMEGTSMATPTAAGIVALWLQASLDENAQHKNLTVNDVKNIMKETAITDAYTTTGANASHFGNGKIDALAGIQYILGTSSGPRIVATPTSVSFEGYATESQTQTVNVKGINLEGNITATLTGATGVYSISQTSISQSAAANGVDITITWSPTTAGTTNATLTLKSTGADDVVINITGVAAAATPTILVDASTLEFNAQLNESQSKTVTVSGRFLTGDVTVTLNDPSGVFSINPTTLTAVRGENALTPLTVTFLSANEGSFTGSVTLTAAGAEPVTLSLTATANDGGTASDAYLDIAKYSTIDDAGWNSTYVNELYKYTEYVSDECAWLTLPVYGAWSACYYNSHPQKWIGTNVTSTNGAYAGTTWSASSPILGSETYFTGGTSGVGAQRAMGNNSKTNTTQYNVTFYVTNATEVVLRAKNSDSNGRGNNINLSTYPTSLEVTECSKNSDGSLTSTSNSSKKTLTSRNTVSSLTIDNLDATKYYKVVVAQYGGYLYEIGFKTSLKKPSITVDPTSLDFSTTIDVPVTKTFNVKGKNLEGVITASLTDANGVYNINPTSITVSEAQSGSGKDVTVTFSPTTAGSYTGTVTLTSSNATSQTVTLNGVATKPVITATPQSLEFTTEATVPVTKTFNVKGTNLYDVISAQLTDANGVYSIDTESISISDAQSGNGKDITVTFSPTTVGTFTGTVTLTSSHAENVIVNLNGTATKHYPDYFDVTINTYGVGTLFLEYPVTIPYDDYRDLLGVYYCYEVTPSCEIKLIRINEVIPANTGVVVQGNAGTYRFPKFTGEVVPPLKYENHFSGVGDEAITVSKALEGYSSSSIVMTLGRGSNGYIGFYKYSGKTLPANKAYLIYDTDNQSSVNMLSFGGLGGEFTGISEINTGVDEGTWYTPQGIRLNGTPKQRGIYIHNGKTVVVK